MAQEEPVTGREKAVPCQHCYARIYRVPNSRWWRADDGTEQLVCDPAAMFVMHKPMPEIRVP